MSITVGPIPHALVPVSPDAARRLTSPNYDEFQGDREIWEYLQEHPECVLRVTMAHCDVESPDDTFEGDSEEALAKSGENMKAVIESDLTREVRDMLFVYEIVGPQNPGVRQIGLGCMAKTAEIRTEAAEDTGADDADEAVDTDSQEQQAELNESIEQLSEQLSQQLSAGLDSLKENVDEAQGRLEEAGVHAVPNGGSHGERLDAVETRPQRNASLRLENAVEVQPPSPTDAAFTVT